MKAVTVIVMLVLVGLLVGCSSEAELVCIPVDPAVIKDIATGLDIIGGWTLRDGWAVPNPNPASPGSHYIAAEIDGPGMEGRGEIGVWMMGPKGAWETGGYVASVNGLAEEFSQWDRPPFFKGVTVPGAEDARKCVKANT